MLQARSLSIQLLLILLSFLTAATISWLDLAEAGRPEHVVYEDAASKMLLTSNAVDVDEVYYCRLTIEGTSFPYFPSSAGT